MIKDLRMTLRVLIFLAVVIPAAWLMTQSLASAQQGQLSYEQALSTLATNAADEAARKYFKNLGTLLLAGAKLEVNKDFQQTKLSASGSDAVRALVVKANPSEKDKDLAHVMVDAMKDAAKQKWRVLEVLSKVIEKASLVWSVIAVESIGKDAIYELSLEKPEDRNTREELGKLARQLLKTSNEVPFSNLVNSRPVLVNNMLKYLPE
jgi:hypothetical protein